MLDQLSVALKVFSGETPLHVHLLCGELDVKGASIPGMPFVLIGRNAAMSWSLTPSAIVETEEIFHVDSASGPLPRHSFLQSSAVLSP